MSAIRWPGKTQRQARDLDRHIAVKTVDLLEEQNRITRDQAEEWRGSRRHDEGGFRERRLRRAKRATHA
jgi:hypothetical protein